MVFILRVTYKNGMNYQELVNKDEFEIWYGSTDLTKVSELSLTKYTMQSTNDRLD